MTRAVALSGLLLLSMALSAGCGGAAPAISGAAGNGESGPELVMSGMLMTDVRPAGVRYRLAADRATYALKAKTVSATGVTFAFAEPAGEVRVTAPAVTWDVGGQTAAFHDGCEAAYPGGYSAKVQVAELDLRERVFNATGPATFSGPGITVDGTDLVWRWREGKADLKQPKSVIAPGAITRPKRG